MLLLEPGVEVVDVDAKQAYRVISVSSVGHKVIHPFRNFRNKDVAEETPITITCAYVDFDGKVLGPVAKTFVIMRFDNRRPVTSLEVFPLRFHPLDKGEDPNEGAEGSEGVVQPGERLLNRLVERGQKFINVATSRNVSYTGKHVYYAGLALEIKDEVESQNVYNDSYVDELWNSEYIADLVPTTRDRQISVSIDPRRLTDASSGEDTFTPDELAIMLYRVFAYILRTRKWAKLDIDYLRDAEESQTGSIPKAGKRGPGSENDQRQGTEKGRLTAFDRLVLPGGHQKVVLSLVAQHFRDKASARKRDEEVDIVRGKGKGLIILLHGAPGVGKTSTAEGVAEKFEKPLFQITCGDLGTTAETVEATLERNFSLANRWGCVLLLDEADVFLAARTKKTFKETAWLQYYAGILFLTTNRIGDFDEAFASRIHISLYYPPLTEDNTVRVFKLNLGMIQERFDSKGRDIRIQSAKIYLFARYYWSQNEKARWNGRQIRNACQTALALAEHDFEEGVEGGERIDAVSLEVRHFEIVSEAYVRFIHYLKDIFGAHDDVRAKEGGLRALDGPAAGGDVNGDEGEWTDEESDLGDGGREKKRDGTGGKSKKSKAPEKKPANRLRRLEAEKKGRARR